MKKENSWVEPYKLKLVNSDNIVLYREYVTKKGPHKGCHHIYMVKNVETTNFQIHLEQKLDGLHTVVVSYSFLDETGGTVGMSSREIFKKKTKNASELFVDICNNLESYLFMSEFTGWQFNSNKLGMQGSYKE